MDAVDAGRPATLLLCITGMTACGSNESPPAPTKTITETAQTSGEPETSDKQGRLPDLTGKGLQEAQDEAQERGFYNLKSTDATGQGRLQIWDRNWTVCSQTPVPGQHATDVTVTFSVAKLDEGCP